MGLLRTGVMGTTLAAYIDHVTLSVFPAVSWHLASLKVEGSLGRARYTFAARAANIHHAIVSMLFAVRRR